MPLLGLLGVLSGCVCCTENNNDDKPPVIPPIEDPPAEDPPAEDPPVDTARRVTVATWNVHRFFDTVCDSGSCEYGQFEKQFSADEYQSKLADITEGISGLDADVVLLQEIETENCLKDISTQFEPETYLNYAFGEIGMTATVDVGILTRGEITAVEKHRDKHWITLPDGSRKRLARELLQAEITLDNEIELTVFVTHLVSKATDPVGDRRLEEAKLCQQIVSDYIAAHPDRLVIFGGDLNDEPESASMQALEKDGILIRSTADMKPKDYYTWQDASALDHIYYNATFKSHLETSKRTCDPLPYRGYCDSDHCALKAVYRFE